MSLVFIFFYRIIPLLLPISVLELGEVEPLCMSQNEGFMTRNRLCNIVGEAGKRRSALQTETSPAPNSYGQYEFIRQCEALTPSTTKYGCLEIWSLKR